MVLDSLTSARALMGASLAFHIIFATIGIGLPLLLLIAEGLALRTGDGMYRDMAKRWGRVAALLFAVGAVSGTALSFEFGLLWPKWMEFAGGVIGFPFALEGFAFFIEAIFLSLYIYGWDRLSPRVHWLCAIPIVLCSAASAFFVISVNGWMNQPAGFTVADGKVVSVDPFAVIFNPAMPYEVIHGTLAAYVAMGFGVAGVYAVAMLRGDHSVYNRKALTLGLAVAAVFTVIQIVSGDASARFLAHNQPEKFAAMEAQFETERGAPLRIGGFPDPETKTTPYAIEIPKLASLLTFFDPDAEVRGLNSFPPNDVPDPRLVHYPFQVMVGIGSFLLFVAAWFWATVWRRRAVRPGRPLLLAIVAAAPLGFVALEAGWLVTEFGRQPWIIYKVMRVSEGVTTQQGVGVVLLTFLLVYVVLTIGLLVLLLRERRRPVEGSARRTEGSGGA